MSTFDELLQQEKENSGPPTEGEDFEKLLAREKSQVQGEGVKQNFDALLQQEKQATPAKEAGWALQPVGDWIGKNILEPLNQLSPVSRMDKSSSEYLALKPDLGQRPYTDEEIKRNQEQVGRVLAPAAQGVGAANESLDKWLERIPAPLSNLLGYEPPFALGNLKEAKDVAGKALELVPVAGTRVAAELGNQGAQRALREAEPTLGGIHEATTRWWRENAPMEAQVVGALAEPGWILGGEVVGAIKAARVEGAASKLAKVMSETNDARQIARAEELTKSVKALNQAGKERDAAAVFDYYREIVAPEKRLSSEVEDAYRASMASRDPRVLTRGAQVDGIVQRAENVLNEAAAKVNTAEELTDLLAKSATDTGRRYVAGTIEELGSLAGTDLQILLKRQNAEGIRALAEAAISGDRETTKGLLSGAAKLAFPEPMRLRSGIVMAKDRVQGTIRGLLAKAFFSPPSFAAQNFVNAFVDAVTKGGASLGDIARTAFRGEQEIQRFWGTIAPKAGQAISAMEGTAAKLFNPRSLRDWITFPLQGQKLANLSEHGWSLTSFETGARRVWNTLFEKVMPDIPGLDANANQAAKSFLSGYGPAMQEQAARDVAARFGRGIASREAAPLSGLASLDHNVAEGLRQVLSRASNTPEGLKRVEAFIQQLKAMGVREVKQAEAREPQAMRNALNGAAKEAGILPEKMTLTGSLKTADDLKAASVAVENFVPDRPLAAQWNAFFHFGEEGKSAEFAQRAVNRWGDDVRGAKVREMLGAARARGDTWMDALAELYQSRAEYVWNELQRGGYRFRVAEMEGRLKDADAIIRTLTNGERGLDFSRLGTETRTAYKSAGEAVTEFAQRVGKPVVGSGRLERVSAGTAKTTGAVGGGVNVAERAVPGSSADAWYRLSKKEQVRELVDAGMPVDSARAFVNRKNPTFIEIPKEIRDRMFEAQPPSIGETRKAIAQSNYAPFAPEKKPAPLTPVEAKAQAEFEARLGVQKAAPRASNEALRRNVAAEMEALRAQGVPIDDPRIVNLQKRAVELDKARPVAKEGGLRARMQSEDAKRAIEQARSMQEAPAMTVSAAKKLNNDAVSEELDRVAEWLRAHWNDPPTKADQALTNYLQSQEYRDSLRNLSALSEAAGIANRNFTMLDYVGGRYNYHAMLGEFVPFPFWVTEEGKTWLSYLMRHPQFANAYMTYDREMNDANASLPENFRHQIAVDFPFGLGKKYTSVENLVNPLNRHIQLVKSVMNPEANPLDTGLGFVRPFPGMEGLIRRGLSAVGVKGAAGLPEQTGRFGMMTPEASVIKDLTAWIKDNYPDSGIGKHLTPGGANLENIPYEIFNAGMHTLGFKDFHVSADNPYEPTRVGRQLLQMALNGEITMEQAKEATWAQQGQAWDTALTKAYSMRLSNDLPGFLASIRFSTLLPSEQQLYDQKKQLNEIFALREKNPNDPRLKDMFSRFYKDNPYYGAWDDRYKPDDQRAGAEVRDKYFALNALDKRLVRDSLGNSFDAFIKDSKAAATPRQLADWLSKLGGLAPASLPGSNVTELQKAPTAQARAYDERSQKAEQLGGWDVINRMEGEYFALPEKSQQRRDYLTAHPDLKAWFDFNSKWRTENPDLARSLGLTVPEPFAPSFAPHAGGGSKGGGGASHGRAFTSDTFPPRPQSNAPHGQTAYRAYADPRATATQAAGGDPELADLILGYFAQPFNSRPLFAQRNPKIAFWLAATSPQTIASLTAALGRAPRYRDALVSRGRARA